MEPIIKEILKNEVDFLFGPGGSVNKTLDATRILNNHLTASGQYVTEPHWHHLQKCLFVELKKYYNPRGGITAIMGTGRPIIPAAGFHDLPAYVTPLDAYTKRKQDRSIETLIILAKIVIALMFFGFIFKAVTAAIE